MFASNINGDLNPDKWSNSDFSSPPDKHFLTAKTPAFDHLSELYSIIHLQDGHRP